MKTVIQAKGLSVRPASLPHPRPSTGLLTSLTQDSALTPGSPPLSLTGASNTKPPEFSQQCYFIHPRHRTFQAGLSSYPPSAEKTEYSHWPTTPLTASLDPTPLSQGALSPSQAISVST